MSRMNSQRIVFGTGNSREITFELNPKFTHHDSRKCETKPSYIPKQVTERSNESIIVTALCSSEANDSGGGVNYRKGGEENPYTVDSGQSYFKVNKTKSMRTNDGVMPKAYLAPRKTCSMQI